MGFNLNFTKVYKSLDECQGSSALTTNDDLKYKGKYLLFCVNITSYTNTEKEGGGEKKEEEKERNCALSF